jgi:hypothetical protein
MRIFYSDRWRDFLFCILALFFEKTCNEARIRFDSNRARDFSSRVESSWVFYKGNENKEQRKKRKLDSTRLEEIQLDSTRFDMGVSTG